MQVEALHPLFGARIEGLDVGAMDEAQFEELLALYYRYSLIVLSRQALAPYDQACLAHRLGRPKIETRKQFNLREHPEVSLIGNARDDDGQRIAFFNRTDLQWHTDGTAACHVNAATLLYAVEVPWRGGDTLFCSTASAYESLPDTLREQARELRLQCSFHAHNDRILADDPDSHTALDEAERAALPPVWHDVVQTHPVTGRAVLYLNADPLEIAGASDGPALLARLFAHCTAPERVYRHRWQAGDLAIWDNHPTLHSPTDTTDYADDRRLLHRSFVYTLPTARPIPNLDELNALFMPDT